MTALRSPQDVLHRALILSELVYRGLQEQQGLGEPGEALHRLQARGAIDALEDDEREILQALPGQLAEATVNRLTWLCEPLYMLLWALEAIGPQPPVEDGISIFGVLLLMSEEDHPLHTHPPRLRSPEEIRDALRLWFWVHRRVYAFVRHPGPMDLRGWIAAAPDGPNPPPGLPLSGDDLDFGGASLGDLGVEHLPYEAEYPAVTGGRLRGLRWILHPGCSWPATGDNPYALDEPYPADVSPLYPEPVDRGRAATGWDSRGGGALQRAAWWGDVEAARALLAAGADLHARDIDGDPPLSAAVSAGEAEVAEVLLEAGADRQLPGGNGRSPLSEAIHRGDAEVARVLLRHGADPDDGGPGQPPVIFCAVGRNDAAALSLLIEGGADIEALDRNDLRPLRVAQGQDALPCVAALIAAGADVMACDWKDQSSLHWAACRGDLERVVLLSERGVALEARSESGYTPLMLAFANDHPSVVRWLLERGAQPASTPAGQTLLHLAARSGSPELLALAPLADLHARAENGLTPLLLAISEGRLAAVEHLLSAGADPNDRDEQGATALHWAVGTGQGEIGRVLLAAGARVDEPPPGLPPLLQLARENGLDELIPLLSGEAGAT